MQFQFVTRIEIIRTTIKLSIKKREFFEVPYTKTDFILDAFGFTAVETTDSSGKRIVAWPAGNRARYLAVFQKLLLDRIPTLKEKRDQIVKMAGSAPGGNRVTILPELDQLVTRFWKDIEETAEKHGVSSGSKQRWERYPQVTEQ